MEMNSFKRCQNKSLKKNPCKRKSGLKCHVQDYSRLLEFLVEKVLKRRIAENGANEYLIKWRPFSVKEATWHRNAMERIGTGYFLSDQRNILTIHPKLYE